MCSLSRPNRTSPLGEDIRAAHLTGSWVGPTVVWTQRIEEKASVSVGDQTPVAQTVGGHYTARTARVTSSSSLFKY